MPFAINSKTHQVIKVPYWVYLCVKYLPDKYASKIIRLFYSKWL